MTTATRLTPGGRGAIAVIEVVGPVESLPFRPANGRPWSEQPLGRLLYGQWDAEDVVVCRIDADRCEIHCHGGDAAVTRILADLQRCGIALDFGPLAPVSGERARVRGPSACATLLEAELRMALSQALTARTADLLNEQFEGTNGVPCLQLWASRLLAPSTPVRSVSEGARSPLAPREESLFKDAVEHCTTNPVKAKRLSSRGARGLHPESESHERPPPHPSPLPRNGGEGTEQNWHSRIAAIDAVLAWSDFGRHLTQPWQVVLTGRPNVGKSSLINALLGFERAIVAEQPGTTRDVVSSITAFDGWPVQLSDTAGQRDTATDLEAAGIERARAALRAADLPIVVLDVGESPTAADQVLLGEWSDAIIVAHKCDRPDQWGNALPAGALRVSSLTGDGLDALQRELVRRLVPAVPTPGTVIPVTPRQVDVLRRMRAACVAEDETEYRRVCRLFEAHHVDD